jgi:hypothetical protein
LFVGVVWWGVGVGWDGSSLARDWPAWRGEAAEVAVWRCGGFYLHLALLPGGHPSSALAEQGRWGWPPHGGVEPSITYLG